MFPRITTIKKDGKTYQYLQLLESYREHGQHKKRVVANLGRVDQLGTKVDTLVKSLNRFCQNRFVRTSDLSSKSCAEWGPILMIRHLWTQMGMHEMIKQVCGSGKQQFDVAENAFVLVANRLIEPSSEHGLARWLEHTYVCNLRGRRRQPVWLPAEAVTKEQRVKVSHRQLNGWYRTLDALLEGKEEIEKRLYFRVRDLFHLEADLVFYDITSTYFQRREPVGRLRRHGHSRDGRPREVQVVVGVVMVNGWPIAHHVFSGNTADKSTVKAVVSDIEKRFGLRNVMVVADRGMVNSENLQFITDRPYRYLVGIQGRRSREAAAVLGALKEGKKSWVKVDEENRVQEVVLGDGGVRYFVVESEIRKAYEQSMRERSMIRSRERLEKIRHSVETGRLKDPAKIGARVGRVLSVNHGARYFSYEVAGEGVYRFWEDEEKMRAEIEREGRYILKTDHGEIQPAEAVEAYKELSTVEAGFRDLKDVLDMRPIWHKTDERIRAHIFIATLALFLKRTLQHHLDQKGVYLSATDALASMKSIGVTELDVEGTAHFLVSTPGPDARRVLKVLGIKDLNPPGVSKSMPK